MSYSRRGPGVTMDGYSRNSKYTETFFHHPTRNHHNTLTYQMRMTPRNIKTFHPKKKSEFQSLRYQSSLNPLSHSYSHHEANPPITGPRKKPIHPFSQRITDPINLSCQIPQPITKLSRPFQATLSYVQDVQRRNYLPVMREINKPVRNYHGQVGLSPSVSERVVKKPQLNNSGCMRSTLQYQGNKVMSKPAWVDDFRYNSRK